MEVEAREDIAGVMADGLWLLLLLLEMAARTELAPRCEAMGVGVVLTRRWAEGATAAAAGDGVPFPAETVARDDSGDAFAVGWPAFRVSGWTWRMPMPGLG